MATLKGTWRFNDVLTKASFYNEVYFDFQTVAIINGESYKLYCNTIYQDVNEPYDSASLQYIAVSSIPDLSELGISFPLGSYVYDGSTKEWRTDLYGEGIQTITFTEEQEVSDEFYTWFTANAALVVPTADSVKAKIQNLIAKANETTGKNDTDLTSGVNSLIEGYGKGGDPVMQILEVNITEKGIFEFVPDAGYDGIIKVVVGVEVPQLTAPTIILNGDILNINATHENTEIFAILVDGVEMATVKNG